MQTAAGITPVDGSYDHRGLSRSASGVSVDVALLLMRRRAVAARELRARLPEGISSQLCLQRALAAAGAVGGLIGMAA